MTTRRLTPALARLLLVDAAPWLSCDDCFDLVDEYLEHLVDDQDYRDPAISAHLRGCRACAEEARSLLELIARDTGVAAAPLLSRLAAP